MTSFRRLGRHVEAWRASLLWQEARRAQQRCPGNSVSPGGAAPSATSRSFTTSFSFRRVYHATPRGRRQRVDIGETARVPDDGVWHPPNSRSPSAAATQEFNALKRERGTSVQRTPKVASDEAVTKAGPVLKSPEQVALEEFAALEQRLGQDGHGVDEKMSQPASPSSSSRPQEPQAEECCGNGCQNCVWIDYWEELQAWEQAESMRKREEKAR